MDTEHSDSSRQDDATPTPSPSSFLRDYPQVLHEHIDSQIWGVFTFDVVDEGTPDEKHVKRPYFDGFRHQSCTDTQTLLSLKDALALRAKHPKSVISLSLHLLSEITGQFYYVLDTDEWKYAASPLESSRIEEFKKDNRGTFVDRSPSLRGHHIWYSSNLKPPQGPGIAGIDLCTGFITISGNIRVKNDIRHIEVTEKEFQQQARYSQIRQNDLSIYKPGSKQLSVIFAVNASIPIETALRDCGFTEKQPGKWITNESTTNSAGGKVFASHSYPWELFFTHNESAGDLCDSHAHDAFDIYVHRMYGGDKSKATAELARKVKAIDPETGEILGITVQEYNDPVYREESNTRSKIQNPLAALRALAVKQETIDAIADARIIWPNVLASGHTTYLVGPNEVGKTTLMRRLAADLAADGFDVFYFDCDSPSSVAKEMFILSKKEGWQYFNPEIETGQSVEQIIELLTALADSDEDLNNMVFFFDTLKKFADMIDKRSLKKLTTLHRKLSSRGACICGAGHDNKKWERDDDGQSIIVPEGTGEIMNDPDMLIILQGTKDEVSRKRVVTTIVEKSQNRFAKNRLQFNSFSYEITLAKRVEDRTVKVLDNVVDIDTVLTAAERERSVLYILEALTTVIVVEKITTPQVSIYKRAAELLKDDPTYKSPMGEGAGLRKVRDVLIDYTYTKRPDSIPKERAWFLLERHAGDHNRYEYHYNFSRVKTNYEPINGVDAGEDLWEKMQ